MENKKMNSAEESMRALISKIPDETLEVAAGKLTTKQRNVLIGLGFLGAVAAAGTIGYNCLKKKPEAPENPPPEDGVERVLGVENLNAANKSTFLTELKKHGYGLINGTDVINNKGEFVMTANDYIKKFMPDLGK